MLLNGKYQCMSHFVCLAQKACQNIVNQHIHYNYGYFCLHGFYCIVVSGRQPMLGWHNVLHSNYKPKRLLIIIFTQ